MADVDASQAQFDYIPGEQANRNAGTAWSAGLGLTRNDTTDPFKVGVNTVDGGRIAGIIPRGFENQLDGEKASMDQFGRFTVPITDSNTLAMGSQLACDAVGKFRLAAPGDFVSAISLGVVSGTGQRGVIQLIPEGAQSPQDGGSGGGTELIAVNKTLTAADHQKTFIATAIDLVFTLPATVLGFEATIINGAVTGGTGLSFSPVTADAINGGSVDKDLINTGATDVLGDACTLVGNGTTGYFTKSQIGTWAAEA